MKTGYKPQPGYILIKKIETEEKSDGLVFVDDKDKPNAKIGEVVATSDNKEIEVFNNLDMLRLDKQDLYNEIIFNSLKIGSIVVYKKYVDFNFTENGEEYVFIKLEDIIAIKESK